MDERTKGEPTWINAGRPLTRASIVYGVRSTWTSVDLVPGGSSTSKVICPYDSEEGERGERVGVGALCEFCLR